MTARDSIIRVALTAGKGGSRKTERWLSPPGQGALNRRNIHLQLHNVLAFLDYLRELPGTSEVKRKSLINIFVNAIYLHDDYYTIIFNARSATLKAENIPLKSIENSLSQAVLETFSGSDFDAFVPPNKTPTVLIHPLGMDVYCRYFLSH